jgi:hypothetical protein
MVVVDVITHSEHVQVIRCDFKPGSVERSIDFFLLCAVQSPVMRTPEAVAPVLETGSVIKGYMKESMIEDKLQN